MIKEDGIWNVTENGNLQSSDFTHDVTLKVSGDFETPTCKLMYATEIARRLNLTTDLTSIK